MAGGCGQAAPKATDRWVRGQGSGEGRRRPGLPWDERMHGRLQSSKPAGGREAGEAGDVAAVPGHWCGAWALLQALGRGSAAAALLKHKRLPP